MGTLTLPCLAVIFFDNDDLLARVGALRRQSEALADGGGSAAAARSRVRAERMSGSSALEHRVTTADLNDVVAQSIAGLVLPTKHRAAWAADVGRASRSARGRDIGPGWQDVRGDEPPPPFSDFSIGSSAADATSDTGDRASWMSAAAGAATAGDSGGYNAAFNARAWVQDMCPAGADLKCVLQEFRVCLGHWGAPSSAFCALHFAAGTLT
jgi:hypothetical protein